MQIFIILIWIIIGYIIGSIPWGLIIGKVFYKKDIRQYGSGNLGGTNAGRVLGKKAGIAVIVLDALKALILMVIARFIYPEAIAYTGAAVMVGHCFPLFANFKGGKGVACAFGYLLALGILGVSDIWFCFVYFIVLSVIIPPRTALWPSATLGIPVSSSGWKSELVAVIVLRQSFS